MRGRLLLGGCLVAAALAGCSTNPPSGDASAESVPSGDASAESVPSITPGGGEGLPADLIGTFAQVGEAAYVTFYEPGDPFCLDEVGTGGSCYAVRDGAEDSAKAIEYGTAAVEDAVLQLTVVEDPKAGCRGTTSELTWETTADGLTLTPIEDCHGTQPVELARE